MQFIEKFLNERQDLHPIPTAMEPVVYKDNSIKAVLFDIYGTLVISGSGDIEEEDYSTHSIEKALEASGITINEEVDNKDTILNNILALHENTVKNEQAKIQQEGYPYPEIDILEVCSEVLKKSKEHNWIIFNNGKDCRSVIFMFELLSNRISPMPGLRKIITSLDNNNIPLGIISNAQFYTPIILNYYLHNTYEEVESVKPFDPELTIFSYKYHRGKPDTQLFEIVKPALQTQYSLKPEEVLYVGNDMLKDIYTAQKSGFKTALFASDKRSLKLRDADNRVQGITPDFIITHLEQLADILL